MEVDNRLITTCGIGRVKMGPLNHIFKLKESASLGMGALVFRAFIGPCSSLLSLRELKTLVYVVRGVFAGGHIDFT
jgi:hypothetical protein